jgi:two-component system, cell cycle sensor histidine kinase and response regulator CckA
MFGHSVRNSANVPRVLAFTYFVFSAAWIIGTDLLVGISLNEELVHIGKGMLFVCVTTILLYSAARYHVNAATQTETTLRHVFEKSQVGIVLLSLDGNIVDCNASFSTFLSCPKSELLGTSIRDWVHGEQSDEEQRLFNLLVAKKTAYRAERKYIRRDEREVWGMISASLVEGNKKERSFVLLMIEDITEARQSHEALARSEARLRRLVQSDVIGVLFWDLAGTIKNPNNALLEMLGYSHEELTQVTWTEITPAEFRHADAEAIRQVRETGVFRGYEKEYIRKDGTRIPVMVGGALFEGGSTEGVAFVLDLSDLRKAQQEIMRLARIVETTDDAVISLSVEGDILTWNRGAEHLYGYKALEIIGKPFLTLFPTDGSKEATRLIETVRRGKTLDHFEAVLVTRSGETKPVSLTVSPMRDSSGNLIGSSTMARDLTAQKHAQELERQFRQAQKLESLGRLAGGIAHDFNNILTVIGSYAQLAYADLPTDSPVRNHAQQIVKATDRAAGLTRQMLAFSRKQLLVPKILDLNHVIEDTVEMVKRLIGEPISVAFHPEDHLWPISADPDQMTQVLLNLCVNARDAMPEGGRLTIETKNVEITRDFKGATLPPGHYVALSVTDTGIGMKREVQDRIFEPFFTTKEVGKGTGLGLATVYGIVKQSGGDILVSSEPDHGSRFELFFPRVDESIALHGQTTVTSESGDETVLVVEDEAALRDCMCYFLKQRGYTVLQAGSGEEADRLAGSFDGVIHLLITDIVMPKMTGRQLSEKLRNDRPGLKTVLMSGYTDDVIEPEMLSDTLKFVQKPFSLTELAQLVREILEQDQ